MDITQFVYASRDRAFLVGDYATYHRQLSRQLSKLRKRLGRSTAKNQKQPSTKTAITATDIATNHGFVHLQLLTAERAWADAMAVKAIHGDAEQDLPGSSRKHVLSRLRKASKHAQHLYSLLHDEKSTCKASDTDALESRAYAASLTGAFEFEKHATQPASKDASAQKSAWRSCLQYLSVAHIIYTALLHETKADVFKETLVGTIDPSIRYAAYQSRIPRTIPVGQIAKQYFPTSEKELVAAVEKLQPSVLKADQAQEKIEANDGTVKDVPTSISWRGRTAPIADASIGQAVATTSLAIDKLSEAVQEVSKGSIGPHTPKILSAAYDPVLNAAQESINATRHAIAELGREGVPEGDSRMQDLRVTDTAVNYELIAWRIGRNRVLTSSPPAPGHPGNWDRDDGIGYDITRAAHSKKNRGAPGKEDTPNGDTTLINPNANIKPVSKQLKELTARITLFDLTLQSLDSIKSLPGAARDQKFQAEIAAQRAYFSSLRALNVAYSYKIVEKQREALALLKAASERAKSIEISQVISTGDSAGLKLGISQSQLKTLQDKLSLETHRQHGLVVLQQIVPPLSSHPRFPSPKEAEAISSHKSQTRHTYEKPLIDQIDTYPLNGRVDLTNLVRYPPRLEAIPLKPIFLDLAWNYIEYPGRASEEPEVKQEVKDQAQPQKQKKGWFGFGRS